MNRLLSALLIIIATLYISCLEKLPGRENPLDPGGDNFQGWRAPTLSASAPSQGMNYNLSWTDTNSGSYLIEEAKKSDFTDAASYHFNGLMLSFSHDDYESSVYYYRVRTNTGNKDSGWSNVVSVEPVKHELIMEIHPSGSGSTEPSVGNYTYNENTVVTIRAIPSPGYMFVNWSGSVANTNSAATTVTMSGDKTVTAEFAKEITMVSIHSGTFRMGDVEIYAQYYDGPVHTVTLSSFEMSIYEITQGQYMSVMGSNPSNSYGVGDTYPMYNVRWYDAVKFCNKLSDIVGFVRCYNESTGACDFNKNGYRLPTEAEWEYACRAGTTTKYYTGDSESDLTTAGWHYYSGGTHPVGQKTPNAWGLYDMHGNVYEWCNDWADSYSSENVTNPTGPQTGSWRVARGGSWQDEPWFCRSANRFRSGPVGTCDDVGFRVVRRPGGVTY